MLLLLLGQQLMLLRQYRAQPLVLPTAPGSSQHSSSSCGGCRVCLPCHRLQGPGPKGEPAPGLLLQQLQLPAASARWQPKAAGLLVAVLLLLLLVLLAAGCPGGEPAGAAAVAWACVCTSAGALHEGPRCICRH